MYQQNQPDFYRRIIRKYKQGWNPALARMLGKVFVRPKK